VGELNPVLAKTEPTPPGVNRSIVLPLLLAAYRLPAESNARPRGWLSPVPAKVVSSPVLVSIRVTVSSFREA